MNEERYGPYKKHYFCPKCKYTDLLESLPSKCVNDINLPEVCPNCGDEKAIIKNEWGFLRVGGYDTIISRAVYDKEDRYSMKPLAWMSPDGDRYTIDDDGILRKGDMTKK